MALNKIDFKVELRSSLLGKSIQTLISPGEDVSEALADAVLQHFGTDLYLTANGVTMFLSAWLNPDHWSEDWAEKGIDDPEEFIANLIEPYRFA